jgi:hypothetical protein
VPPDADICSETALPTVPVWLPGLFTVTELPPPPPAVNAAVPLGVPSPDGPSQPALPSHSTLGEHEPLAPEVTSNRLPVCAYG